jgi:hypothetical protein
MGYEIVKLLQNVMYTTEGIMISTPIKKISFMKWLEIKLKL